MTARTVGTSVAKAAALIAVVTLLARLAGFGRTIVFSRTVGAGGVGDTYQTVNMLPNVVYEVAAGGALAAVAVPLIASQLGAGRRADADRTASALLTWAVAVLVPLSVLLALTAPWLSDALLGDSTVPGAAELGTTMLLVFAPQVALYGVGVVLAGVLQAHRRFLAAALAPLLSSLVVIAAYVGYRLVAEPGTSPADISASATWALAGGTTLGVVVLSLPLLVPAVRAGVRLRPTFSFPEGVARRAGSLAGAGVIALVAQQAAVAATLWLTHAPRTVDTGVVNVYTYVQAVYLLPYAVLAVPIATSAFPALAHTSAAEELKEQVGTSARDTLAAALRGILLLTAGAATVLMAVSRPVGVFFSSFDSAASSGGGAALAALPGALSAYAPGLVGFSVAALLTRALYVRGRPIHAALAVAAGWSLAALIPVALIPEGSVAGTTLGILGVGSTVGMTVSAAVLALLVRSAWGPEAVQGSGRTLGAAVVAAAVGLAVGDTVARGLSPDTLWSALGSGLLVGLVTLLAYLGVMMVADRKAMTALRERGRARRRGTSA
ncbi:murein biosynthesis integral membrane protein MurJ [Phycicoccus sp. Soil803]|uniref:murein biosynthesis integral membrane protein MurJ n=1 Tax=Phycicoccus sp. Soil803 TaxID=1736415 RepID=UPI000AFD2609|nr:lipid II flippase MurJ [Phycicoccus sp. Soil803]